MVSNFLLLQVTEDIKIKLTDAFEAGNSLISTIRAGKLLDAVEGEMRFRRSKTGLKTQTP